MLGPGVIANMFDPVEAGRGRRMPRPGKSAPFVSLLKMPFWPI